jgi:hypothetical protein
MAAEVANSKTKEVVKRYFDDLKRTINGFVRKPTNESIARLEEVLSMGGLSTETIESIYLNCGFYSWQEYINTKHSFCSADQKSRADCVDRKLIGTLSSLEFAYREYLYG